MTKKGIKSFSEKMAYFKSPEQSQETGEYERTMQWAEEQLGVRPAVENHLQDLHSAFFAKFGEQSFRGYPLEQCWSIWEFFKPHLK